MSVSQIFHVSNNCPAPILRIQHPAVFHACFCNKIVEPVYEESTTTYTVRRGDWLSKIARRHNVEMNTIRRSNPDGSSSAISHPYTIHTGEELILPSITQTGENVYFEYLEEALIGQEVFIVVETQGLREKCLKITVRQGVECIIAEPIFIGEKERTTRNDWEIQ